MKIAEPILIDFEEELNQISFLDVPLGGLASNMLLVDFLMGNRAWSLKDRLQDRLSIISLLHRKNRSYFKKAKSDKLGSIVKKHRAKPLLTFIDSKPHFFNINRKVLEELGETNALCFLRHSRIRLSFEPANVPTLIDGDIQGLSHKEWKNQLKPIKKDLEQAIVKFTRKSDLPYYTRKRIYSFVLLQTQRLFALEHLLKRLEPNFILVEYDRHTWCSPLVLMARKMGIPSFSLMHGVVNNRFAYLPLLADNLLCWGERQKNLLKGYAKSSAEMRKLLVTGAPQLKRSLAIDRESVVNKLNLDPQTDVVLLASNPIGEELRRKLVRIFCEAINSDKTRKGIIRLHPSESLDFYKEEIESYPNILFDDGQFLSFEESLAIANVCCIYNSAFGIDAITKGKSVFVINVNEQELGQGRDFIEEGNFPNTEDASGLKDLIAHYFSNSKFKAQVDQDRESYAKRYCFAYSNDAAKIALEQIAEKIN